jgi:hypothetical protein
MRTLFHDVRFGLRLMRKTPGFTMVAILVLTLAIGGTAAMFSVINALVLKPLPVREPDKLVRLYNKENKPSGSFRSFSYGDYVDLRERSACISDLMAFGMAMIGANEGDTTRRTFGALVSANYFEGFGVKMHAGRAFFPSEERPGSLTSLSSGRDRTKVLYRHYRVVLARILAASGRLRSGRKRFHERGKEVARGS